MFKPSHSYDCTHVQITMFYAVQMLAFEQSSPCNDTV